MAVPVFRVLVAFGTDPLAADPAVPAQWTDISDYLDPAGFTIQNGKRNELDTIQPAQASVTLDNRDRRFEMDYASSPYYPNVIAGAAARFIATWGGFDYTIIRGYALAWKPSEDERPATVALTLTDVIGAYFSRVTLGSEILYQGFWENAIGVPYASFIGTQPGNRKVLLHFPDLPSGTSVSVGISGTRGGDGAAISESLVSTSIAPFDLSANNYRKITSLAVNGYSGTIPNGLPFSISNDATFPAEYSGDHIKSLLHTVGWMDIATNTVISNGISLLQSYGPTGTLLAALIAAVEAESGTLFVNRAGTVIFQNRHEKLTPIITESFVNRQPNDTGYVATAYTEILYERITFDTGENYIYNEVTLQRTGGIAQTQRDSASKNRHFLRTYRKSDLKISTDTEVNDAAGWRLNLYKTQKRRVASLMIRSNLLNSALWPQLLTLSLGRKVLVKHTPVASGAAVEQTCIIEQMVWRGTRNDWTLTLALSPGIVGNFLMMDDATYGLVDLNVVAY